LRRVLIVEGSQREGKEGKILQKGLNLLNGKLRKIIFWKRARVGAKHQGKEGKRVREEDWSFLQP